MFREVEHAKTTFIVEKRGKPVVAIVPLAQVDLRTLAQRLAAVIGFGGPEGDEFYEFEFYEFMKEVVKERRRRMPREVPEIPEE